MLILSLKHHSTGCYCNFLSIFFFSRSYKPTRLKFPQNSSNERVKLHRFRNENDRLKDPPRVRERARLCRRGFDTSVGGEPSTKTWPVVPRPHLDKLARLPSRCQRAQSTPVSGFGKLPLPNGMNGGRRSLMRFDGKRFPFP